jgi:L-ascorbate metabolism protein UlaG (beta-lactamase superfamily)
MSSEDEDTQGGFMKIQRLSVSMIDPWLTHDPFWPKAERTPAKLREIDVIAITHAHFDHASGIDEIIDRNPGVSIIAQYEFAFSLMNRGIKNVFPTSSGATVEFQGIKFSPVPASHTSSVMDAEGEARIVGTSLGYIIEFEDGVKVYASGDTGLMADMKLVVGDYHQPLIAILPATGFVLMEPEQAAYAAHMTGCRYAIPFHDFPCDITAAADPEGYRQFLSHDPFGVLDSAKKIDIFLDKLQKDYPHIQGVYIPIGETAEI